MIWRLEPPEELQRRQASAERHSRRDRWNAKGKARVVHPARGTVVVPHSSNLAALMNAAEVWGCDWTELREARVWVAEPGDVAVKMPYII